MSLILHVDRSSFYKKIVENSLAMMNLQYISADSIKESFNILKSKKIDLIITGLELKEEIGEDFIISVNNSEYKQIPIIVLSSTDNIEVKKRLFNLGISDYILKDNLKKNLAESISKFKLGNFQNEKVGNIKIAVLDDDKFQLFVMKNILIANGIVNVDYYTNPVELLRTEKNYDLYMIDLVLPQITGEQVITEIRKRNQYSAIIAMSDISNCKVISNLLASGCNDYLIKPFNENIFMARLKASIRTFELVEQLKEKNLELKNLANIDSLTRLYNHEYIYNSLEQEIVKSRRFNEKLSIIMFDIDKFKNINDVYGHQVGDKVLLDISNKLKFNFRKTDIIGRYGGEEFVVILPETELNTACNLMEGFRIMLQKSKFDEENLKVTVSAGIAELNLENAKELIKKSDKLLYMAKENGRNRIEV